MVPLYIWRYTVDYIIMCSNMTMVGLRTYIRVLRILLFHACCLIQYYTARSTLGQTGAHRIVRNIPIR